MSCMNATLKPAPSPKRGYTTSNCHSQDMRRIARHGISLETGLGKNTNDCARYRQLDMFDVYVPRRSDGASEAGGWWSVQAVQPPINLNEGAWRRRQPHMPCTLPSPMRDLFLFPVSHLLLYYCVARFFFYLL